MNPDCFAVVLTAVLCNHPVLPNEWPSAKVIHVPPGFIEHASPAARERWLVECRPQRRTDQNGVTRFFHAKPGCEFGPDRE
jgi:hypothetical protein